MRTPRLTKDGKLPHITMPLKYGKMASDIQDLFTERLPNHTLAEVCRYIAGYFYRQQKANEEHIEELKAELAEERRSREEAQAFAWTFSDALREIAAQPNDNALRPNFRIAMAALGQWQWPECLTEKKDD